MAWHRSSIWSVRIFVTTCVLGSCFQGSYALGCNYHGKELKTAVDACHHLCVRRLLFSAPMSVNVCLADNILMQHSTAECIICVVEIQGLKRPINLLTITVIGQSNEIRKCILFEDGQRQRWCEAVCALALFTTFCTFWYLGLEETTVLTYGNSINILRIQ